MVSVLSDIFMILGKASILESDSGVEFTNHIVIELSEVWSYLKIVSAKYHPGQGQGSLEQARHDVKNVLSACTSSNHSYHWAKDLHFMQMMRNQAFDVSWQQSPYKAMFGCKANLGRYSSYPGKLTVLQTKEEPEIAEEELQNSLCIRQEERAEIGTERSDVDKDIHPTPPKATEPSASQGPRSLLVNRHLLHGHSWCLWALFSHLRTIAKGPGERNEGCTLRSSCPWQSLVKGKKRIMSVI